MDGSESYRWGQSFMLGHGSENVYPGKGPRSFYIRMGNRLCYLKIRIFSVHFHQIMTMHSDFETTDYVQIYSRLTCT